MMSNFPAHQQIGDEKYVLGKRHCVYCQFSMLKCYRLGICSPTIAMLSPGVKRTFNQVGDSESPSSHSKNYFVFVICKESVKLNSRTACESKLRFCATAFVLDANVFSSGNAKKLKSDSSDKLKSGSDSSEQKSGVTKLCDDQKGCTEQAIQANTTSQRTGNPIENYLKTIHESTDALHKTKVDSMRSDILLFRGEAVKWYDVLHAGQIYKLRCPGGELNVLKKTAPKSGTKSCIALPENVEVEMVSRQEPTSPWVCSSSGVVIDYVVRLYRIFWVISRCGV